MIEDKIENGDKAAPKPAKKHKATNVIDLVSVLQKSLQQTKGNAKGGKKEKKVSKKSRASHTAHKKAA